MVYILAIVEVPRAISIATTPITVSRMASPRKMNYGERVHAKPIQHSMCA